MNTEQKLIKLPKAPLQEVIFEVKWDLDINPQANQLYDSGIEAAVGQLKSAVKDHFPVFKRRYPIDFPVQMLNYQVIYQYWKSEQIWPVLQLGPGIFSINDTDKEYTWSGTFFPLLKKSLSWLEDSYEKHLNYISSSLRYIDIIKIKDYNFTNWKDFVSNNLNFSFQNNFNTRGDLKLFQFSQVFDIGDSTDLQVIISNGRDAENNEILIWENNIISNQKLDITELIKWVESAHRSTSELFIELCSKDLYDSFAATK
jgi:uncharacterized protein (TIGR04255 family)